MRFSDIKKLSVKIHTFFRVRGQISLIRGLARPKSTPIISQLK